MLNARMSQGKRFLLWLLLSALAALIAYFAFRAYLTPELLFHFSSAFYC